MKDRLTKEINYWDHRAEELKLQEQAGKPNARLNSERRASGPICSRGGLQKRIEELKLEAQISPLPPVVLGGFVVVPKGLLLAMTGAAAQTLTVTKNEILCLLNTPEDFILAIVEFVEGGAYRVHYARSPSSESRTSTSRASTTTTPNCWRGREAVVSAQVRAEGKGRPW